MHFISIPKQAGKPHVLFANIKYLAGNPSQGECAWKTLIHSFAANGAGTYDVFFYDAARADGVDPDWKILELCKANLYDAVILYWYPAPGKHNVNLSPDTLYLLRNALGVRIASIFYDTWSRALYLQAEGLAPFLDIAVVTDSLSHFEHSNQKDKYINLCFAPDTTIFNDPGMKRDIPVSLNGTSNIYRDKILDALHKKNIPCLNTGGYNNYLPIEDYAEIYKRSKISLNSSWTPKGKRTFKARVMEATLCGSMLIEQENDETARRFRAYEDFVPYTDEEDLAKKISYYLEHDDERLVIAEKGKKRAQELASPEKFWGKLLDAVASSETYNPNDAYKAIGQIKILFENGFDIRSITHCLHLLEGQKVAAWGSGSYYRNKIEWWLNTIKDKLDFVGFVDSNPEKWGSYIDGYPVFNPKDLKKHGINSVILSTYAGHEIFQQYGEICEVDFYM